jgi:CYTH domain-containing protein
MGSANGLEIERKWLIAGAPSADWLRAYGAVAKRIEQVYLARVDATPGGWRIRRTESEGTVKRFETRKRSLGGFTREEIERTIDEAEYERLLREADPSRQPIRKTRWVFPFGGHELELDVFESPPGIVVLEIELGSEDEAVELPPDLAIVREVTADRTYLNWNLASRGEAAPPAPGA